MMLTKEMAEEAKALIYTIEQNVKKTHGVCRALLAVSDEDIDLLNRDDEFWGCSEYKAGYRWPFTHEGDIKRRAFIDSLIGKDL